MKKLTIAFLAVVILLSGCATISENPTIRRTTSAVIGGIVGAVHCAGKKGSALDCIESIAVGAVAGLAIGEIAFAIKESYQERRARIAEISKNAEVEIETSDHIVLDEEGVEALNKEADQLSKEERAKKLREAIAFRTKITDAFASNSADLSPANRRVIRAIAAEYKREEMREVLIVGHADSVGDARANQLLSEARALTVANIFVEEGFPKEQIYYQGAGESEPIGDNTNTDGRARNRRVELVDASTAQSLARAKHFYIKESTAAIMPQEKPSAQQPEIAVAESQPKQVDFGAKDSVVAFDGKPYSDKLAETALGVGVRDSNWNEFFVSAAHASANKNIPRFINDDIPVVGDIKRTDGGKSLYNFADYLPGYRDLTVYFRHGEKLLSLHPVGLLQERVVDSSQVAGTVYAKTDGEWVTESTLTGGAVSYPSRDKNLALYRWKADAKSSADSGIHGVDIVLRAFTEEDFGATQTLPAKVFYVENGALHIANINMTIKLPKDINPDWRFY